MNASYDKTRVGPFVAGANSAGQSTSHGAVSSHGRLSGFVWRDDDIDAQAPTPSRDLLLVLQPLRHATFSPLILLSINATSRRWKPTITTVKRARHRIVDTGYGSHSSDVKIYRHLEILGNVLSDRVTGRQR